MSKNCWAQSTEAGEYTNSRGVRPPPNECPKKSDGEPSVMLELWGMQSTPLLPLFPGPLWPGVVAVESALSIGQIKLFDI